jgi:hypothetical protein
MYSHCQTNTGRLPPGLLSPLTRETQARQQQSRDAATEAGVTGRLAVAGAVAYALKDRFITRREPHVARRSGAPDGHGPGPGPRCAGAGVERVDGVAVAGAVLPLRRASGHAGAHRAVAPGAGLLPLEAVRVRRQPPAGRRAGRRRPGTPGWRREGRRRALAGARAGHHGRRRDADVPGHPGAVPGLGRRPWRRRQRGRRGREVRGEALALGWRLARPTTRRGW